MWRDERMRAIQAGARPWAAAAVVLVLGLAASTRSTAAQAGPTVKEFSITAERFQFTPDRLEVNQGDTVRITARSADGTHGFEIKKLKVEKLIPRGGEPVVIEFLADKAGTFEFKCSEYCGRGHSRMMGVLVVNPTSH
jgi:cytochrome c oxidase subunit II